MRTVDEKRTRLPGAELVDNIGDYLMNPVDGNGGMVGGTRREQTVIQVGECLGLDWIWEKM